MENAVAIAAVAGPMYIVVGLSVLLYVKSWQKLLDQWKTDHFTLFPLMFFYVAFGVIVIRMYNVWEWNVWLIVTLIGWILLLKGIFYFLAPGSLIKAVLKIKDSKPVLYIAGIIAVLLGAVLSYYVYLV